MASDNRLSGLVSGLSGIAALWQGIHDQVDAKEVSSTKLWDVSLRHQVNALYCN